MTGQRTTKERPHELRPYYGHGNRPAKTRKGPSGLLSMLARRGSGENVLTVEDGAIIKTTDISLTYDRASCSNECAGQWAGASQ